MGFYDIPAELDYILNVTGQEKLVYVGHSMGILLISISYSFLFLSLSTVNMQCLIWRLAGTTMFWVAMETHPELNQKIELMVRKCCPSIN